MSRRRVFSQRAWKLMIRRKNRKKYISSIQWPRMMTPKSNGMDSKSVKMKAHSNLAENAMNWSRNLLQMKLINGVVGSLKPHLAHTVGSEWMLGSNSLIKYHPRVQILGLKFKETLLMTGWKMSSPTYGRRFLVSGKLSQIRIQIMCYSFLIQSKDIKKWDFLSLSLNYLAKNLKKSTWMENWTAHTELS